MLPNFVDVLRGALLLPSKRTTLPRQNTEKETTNSQEKDSGFVDTLREVTNDTQNQPQQNTPEQTIDTDTITYTYKPGDSFGRVITDLGLRTDAGLWGANGDVAYYTQQLAQQGALDRNGNIPIGTTLRLRRRGSTAEPLENPSQDSSQPGYTGYDVDADTITYTYKPGDTFSKVIRDLGLGTDAGLWGTNGDVAYYTQQLSAQGALDRNGNIPIGTTIRLRRRNAQSGDQSSPDNKAYNNQSRSTIFDYLIKKGNENEGM